MGLFGWILTRNDSFQTTEDALNSLDSKEVEGEALEDGEDEEQVDKGQESYILTTTIRRLKPIAIVNKNTSYNCFLNSNRGTSPRAWVTQTRDAF